MKRFVMPTASLKPFVGKECRGLPITVTAIKCRQPPEYHCLLRPSPRTDLTPTNR